MIHIALCADTHYVMPTSVAMMSICEHHPDIPICFHIVVTDGKEEEFALLKSVAERAGKEINLYPISGERFRDFMCTGSSHVSVTGFARIFLPDLLPQEVHRLIYLDGDVVVRSSLQELWDFPLVDDDPLGAVIDVEGLSPYNRRAVKTPLTIPYCNSGVLLLNLDSWRRENLTEQVAQCARTHAFPLLDQDVLHFFFQKRVRLLPIRYNVQAGFLARRIEQQYVEYQYLEELEAACKDPVVVHFTMGKPWKTLSCAYREEWERCYSRLYSTPIEISEQHPAFAKSKYCRDFDYLYWMDFDLFQQAVPRYLDFYGVLIHMKHRRQVMKILSSLLSFATKILTIIYRKNLKKIEKTY